MFIGITYDLQEDYINEGFSKEESAEFDKIETIEAIEKSLQKLGHKTERIGNVKRLINMLNNNSRWDFVFNICEGMYGIGRESQVPAILDAYNIPYSFSDPMVLSLTLHKGMAKRVIRDLNIPTANFCVIETKDDISKVDLKYPLFIKPVAEGTGKGISEKSKVSNMDELRINTEYLLEKYNQAVLIEEYLPGREFTVGIIGTGLNAKVIGVLEVLIKKGAEKSGYSYNNKDKYEEFVEYRLVENMLIKEECEALALAAWRGLGCRDGGRIDIRYDRYSQANFIEVNPLAGLHPEHSDLPILTYKTGKDYQYIISGIMTSALERLKLQ